MFTGLATALESLRLFWTWIVPPMSAAPEVQYWYRVRVAAVACAALMSSAVSNAVNYGFVPGFSGFASAADLRQLRIHLIDNDLLELRIHHCEATNAEAKQEYLRRIHVGQNEYYGLTHQDYPLPTCDEVQ